MTSSSQREREDRELLTIGFALGVVFMVFILSLAWLVEALMGGSTLEGRLWREHYSSEVYAR